jgi:hypothetical protein
VPVLDSRSGQRDFQHLLLEVRVTPGSGKAADVSEHLDVEGAERFNEHLERMGGVTYRPYFQLGVAHEKVIRRLGHIGPLSLGVLLSKHRLI